MRTCLFGAVLFVSALAAACARTARSEPLPVANAAPALPRHELDPFAVLDGRPSDPERAAWDALTFSGTTEWGNEFRLFLSLPARHLGADEEQIVLPPPPASSSERTRRELELLRAYKAARTPARLARIRAEMSPEGMQFGGVPLRRYLGEGAPELARTGRLLRAMLDEATLVLFRMKRRFDRVRPHQLDPTIAPVIDVPSHPAYPSGHSTEAHVTAYVLAELVPSRRHELEADALEIAIDREIAGVHFPSDTAAGALLARQIVDRMVKDPEVAGLLEAAKVEWRIR